MFEPTKHESFFSGRKDRAHSSIASTANAASGRWSLPESNQENRRFLFFTTFWPQFTVFPPERALLHLCRQKLAALQISRNSARSSSRRSDTTTSLKEGFMERSRLLQNGATTEESGALLSAGDYSPHAFSQSDGAAIQTDSSKIRPHAHALQQHRPARFGLPCANCKAYYASDLHACQSANVPSASPPRRRKRNRQTG